MIKLICFVKKKPGLDRDAFRRHWLEEHGPLIRRTPELADPVLRYEQNHRLDNDYERAPDGYDGITMQWFAAMEDFVRFIKSQAYPELIAPDEAKFLDRTSLWMIFAGPANRPIVNEPARLAAGVKLMAMLTKKPGLEPAVFRAHWRSPHGELFRDTPELARHVAAYEQHPRLDGDYIRDSGPGPDGLAEQWYADLDAFRSFVGEPAQSAIIRPDEDRFLDRSKIEFILTGPAHVIIDSRDRDQLEREAADATDARATESHT
jgi:hypothetical protein